MTSASTKQNFLIRYTPLIWSYSEKINKTGHFIRAH